MNDVISTAHFLIKMFYLHFLLQSLNCKCGNAGGPLFSSAPRGSGPSCCCLPLLSMRSVRAVTSFGQRTANCSGVCVDPRTGVDSLGLTWTSRTRRWGKCELASKCTGLTNREAMHVKCPNSHQQDVAQTGTLRCEGLEFLPQFRSPESLHESPIPDRQDIGKCSQVVSTSKLTR